MVDLSGASKPARGPWAIGDANEEGGIDCPALGLPELQDQGQESRIDIPDGREDKDDDGEAGDAPHESHLDLEQPQAETLQQVSPHSFEAACRESHKLDYVRKVVWELSLSVAWFDFKVGR